MKSRNLNRYHLKEKVNHGTPLLPLSIYHLSYLPQEDNYFQLHWHDEVEFTIVLSGAILYTIDHEEISLTSREGLFINANRVHSAKSLNGEPCEACVVVFHPMLMHQDLNSDSYSRFVYPILHQLRQVPSKLTPNVTWHKALLQLLASFDTLKEDNLDDSELLIKGYLYQMWHLLHKNSVDTPYSHQKSSYKVDRMKPVLSYIHNHYSEELTLEELASMIPMSKGQFCRSFKEIVGMSPMSYVIHYRIEESCHLLEDTNKKIADISKHVGFNTISYFNREFQKKLSTSPKVYRKNNRLRLTSMPL